MTSFEAFCQQHGIAATHPRRVIYEALLEHDGHPSPELVYEAVRSQVPSVSLATIYKNLKLFEDVGLVREVSYPGAKSARYDVNLTDHQHLVCLRCETMVDVVVGALQHLRLPEEQAHGFAIHSSKVYFEGLCQDCQRTSLEGTAPAHEAPGPWPLPQPSKDDDEEPQGH
jgi:Fur family peroxide stress response transcriptional regulator